ncbi:LysE family translocator [Halarcobacter ebronensis]|uniref:Lysine transporter LysE n=1 Tax=Halarcobacter ebronensis TaxID=1462615 RepID=A0A4Q1AMH7_9BACT|nr:LysE family transporter [Halarcobacter ebronensis]QKF81835.1 transporter, LysE family [Halarcobacter ebronensis]RXK01566.1 lysine transporter LysE [Halarcobacter ebronensis]
MNILSFLIYCIIITFTPGPTHIVTLSTVQNYGVKRAVSFCYGASIAFVIILVLSVILNSLLASFIPKAMLVMEIIGASYILYLAYQIYNMDNSSNEKKDFGTFKSGFLMQFINPKVILFCITVFPSFIMPYYSSLFELLIFAIVVASIGSMSFFFWVIFGSLLKSFLKKHKRISNTLLSLFLVYCAIMISGVTEFS